VHQGVLYFAIWVCVVLASLAMRAKMPFLSSILATPSLFRGLSMLTILTMDNRLATGLHRGLARAVGHDLLLEVTALEVRAQ